MINGSRGMIGMNGKSLKINFRLLIESLKIEVIGAGY